MSRKTFHPLRLEEIKNTSIPFPIFFFDGDEEDDDDIEEYYNEYEDDDIVEAYYIDGMSQQQDINGMPLQITFIKELGNGLKTKCVYNLAGAVKSTDETILNIFNPGNN